MVAAPPQAHLWRSAHVKAPREPRGLASLPLLHLSSTVQGPASRESHQLDIFTTVSPRGLMLGPARSNYWATEPVSVEVQHHEPWCG